MTLTSISGSYGYQTNSAATTRKEPKELQALSQALQSGDLTAAQQAFTAFEQHAPQGAPAAGNAVVTDISDLGKALSSGDLSGAQTAFASLTQDVQDNPPPPPPSGGSTDSGTASQAQTLFGQLAKALQNGDLSAAQDAFSSLQALSANDPGVQTSEIDTTLTGDVSALRTALNAGDLTSAQTAFSTLLADLNAQHSRSVASYADNSSSSTDNTSGVVSASA